VIKKKEMRLQVLFLVCHKSRKNSLGRSIFGSAVAFIPSPPQGFVIFSATMSFSFPHLLLNPQSICSLCVIMNAFICLGRVLCPRHSCPLSSPDSVLLLFFSSSLPLILSGLCSSFLLLLLLARAVVWKYEMKPGSSTVFLHLSYHHQKARASLSAYE